MATVIRTIGEGTFWISSSTIVLKFIGLATVFLILSHLGVAEYGTLELVLSITTLLSIFLLPGLDSMISADMSAEKGRGELNRARALLKSFFWLQMMLGTLAGAAVFFGAQYFADLYTVPQYYVQFISLLFLLSPIRVTFSIVFKVHLDFLLQSMVGFVEECIKLGCIVFFFFYTDMDIGGVLLANVLAQVVMLVILSPWALSYWKGMVGGDIAVTPKPWELLYDHGKWGVLSTYMGNFARSLRLWIIQRMLGPEAVGIYAVAIGLVGHTTALMPLSTTIGPLLAQFSYDPKRFTRLLNKSIKYQLMGNIIVATLAAIVFPPVLGILFPTYQSAFPLFRVMLIGMLPGAVTSVATPAFVALKLQRSFFFSMLYKTVLTGILSYGGILLFGIWGVAFESIMTAVFQSVERIISLKRRMPGITLSPLSMFTHDADDMLIREKLLSLLRRLPVMGKLL